MSSDERPRQALRMTEQASAQERPSAARKRFNTLVRRLENCRRELARWDEALSAFAGDYQRAMVPLLERYRRQQAELVLALDQACLVQKLGRRDRALASEIVCELAAPLIDGGMDELKPVYDRHSELGFDEERAEAEDLLKAAAAESFGLDAEQLAGIRTPEDFFEHLSEQIEREQAEREAAAAAAQSRRRGRAAGPRAGDKLQLAAEASLRELFRKLAGMLHPDRERDPQQRERKTGLMQRLNRAYAAKDLLALLELQLEIGQLQAGQLQAMSEERIRQYNHSLAAQLKQVEGELANIVASFEDQYQLLPGGELKPARLPGLLKEMTRQLADDIAWQQRELRELSQPDALKPWIRRKAQLLRQADSYPGMSF